MSLRGYCRTLNDRIACSPAMRMTRFTTIASTGRLTNKSVIFISASQTRKRNLGAPGLAEFARLGIRTFRGVLAVFRLRAGVVVRFYVVVNDYRCSVA